jgi:hypothetical protein
MEARGGILPERTTLATDYGSLLNDEITSGKAAPGPQESDRSDRLKGGGTGPETAAKPRENPPKQHTRPHKARHSVTPLKKNTRARVEDAEGAADVPERLQG